MFKKNRLITLLPVAALFMLLFFSLENGCDQRQTDIYSMPFSAESNKKIFLALQTYSMQNDKDKFILMSAAKPFNGNWAKPKSFQGKIAAVLSGSNGIVIIFKSGAVVDCSYESGKYKLSKRPFSDLKILSAGGNTDNIYAVTNVKNQLAVFKFTENHWQQEGPLLKPAGAFINPHICFYKKQPVVIWQKKGAPENSKKLRWAKLEENHWKSLPVPDLDLSGNIIKFKKLADDLVVLAQNGLSASFVESKEIAVLKYSGNNKHWLKIPAVKVPPELDNSFTPLADFLENDKKIHLVLSTGNALSIAEANPVTLRLSEFKSITKSNTPNPEDELSLMLLFLFIFLAVGVFQIFLRKKILQKTGTVLPEMDNIQNLNKTLPTDGTAPAIGGIASPLERGIALGIDMLITTPLLFAFIAAQDVELNSIETIKDLIIPASVFYNFSFMIYAVITEFIWNQTVGKKALGLYVRAAKGGSPEKTKIIIRNLFRGIDNMLIPGLNIPFFPAIVSMILSRTNQRLGDRFAGTVVVRKVPVKSRKIILASGSPRRSKILEEMDLNFEVIVPNINEKTFPAFSCTENAMQLARQKADQVGDSLKGDEIIIAADTIIEFDGKIIGKPENREEATRILSMLSGSLHKVITGLAVWDKATGKKITAAEITEIQMNPINREEIEEYVASGEADDKAGAYAVQGEGGKFIRYMTGSYSNVVGLPVELLRTILDDLEI